MRMTDDRFARELERGRVPLLRICMGRFRLDQNTAEDLVQDAMVKAWNARSSYRGEGLTSYLYRTAFNLFMDRKRVSRETVSLETTQVKARDDYAALDAEFVAEACLERASREIDSMFLDVVRLVDMDEHSYDEAAEIIGCPVGTVRSRISRARLLMRAHCSPLVA